MKTFFTIFFVVLICPQIYPSDKIYDVVVVGAGISGLTAACLLDYEDYSIKVLEKEDRVGGRVLSGDYRGFKYAKGTEYLGKPEGILKTIIKKLKLKKREIPSPTDAFWFDGEFYYGEEGIALMFIERSSVSQFNTFVSLIQSYAKEYKEIPDLSLDSPIAKLDEISAYDFLIQKGFSKIFQNAYNVFSRGLFGASLKEISALSFLPEAYFDYYDATPIKNKKELKNTLEPKGKYKTGTYTFTNGIAEITKAMADYLDDKIKLNCEVTKVTKTGNIFTVTYSTKNKKQESYRAKAVILAVPAPIAYKLAQTELSNEQKNILQQIPYANYITVALFCKEYIYNKSFDCAVQDGMFFTDIYDATWVQRWYDKKVRNKKESVMTLYIAADSYKDTSLLEMSDKEILQKSYNDLEKIFPNITTKIIGYDIHRFPYAYPVMTLGAYKRLTRLHQITNGPLQLAGDYMIYPTLEAAVDSAEIAVDKILELDIK